jgi:hypothetical protein
MTLNDMFKTAFKTHNGRYKFLLMLFSLTNVPDTFQSLMNEIFRAYLRKFILVFIDNIFIYNKFLANHS